MINVRVLSFDALPKLFRRVSRTEEAPLALKESRGSRGFLADFEQMLTAGLAPILPDNQDH